MSTTPRRFIKKHHRERKDNTYLVRTATSSGHVDVLTTFKSNENSPYPNAIIIPKHTVVLGQVSRVSPSGQVELHRVCVIGIGSLIEDYVTLPKYTYLLDGISVGQSCTLDDMTVFAENITLGANTTIGSKPTVEGDITAYRVTVGYDITFRGTTTSVFTECNILGKIHDNREVSGRNSHEMAEFNKCEFNLTKNITESTLKECYFKHNVVLTRCTIIGCNFDGEVNRITRSTMSQQPSTIRGGYLSNVFINTTVTYLTPPVIGEGIDGNRSINAPLPISIVYEGNLFDSNHPRIVIRNGTTGSKSDKDRPLSSIPWPQLKEETMSKNVFLIPTDLETYIISKMEGPKLLLIAEVTTDELKALKEV